MIDKNMSKEDKEKKTLDTKKKEVTPEIKPSN